MVGVPRGWRSPANAVTGDAAGGWQHPGERMLDTVRRVRVERFVEAPIEAVFDWLADPQHLTSAPLALRVKLVRGGDMERFGVGAIREVTTVGAWFREQITRFEPPTQIHYSIVRSYPRIVHRGGTITLTEAPGGTRAVWVSEYAVSRAWGGRMTASLLQPALSWSFGRILEAASEAASQVPARMIVSK